MAIDTTKLPMTVIRRLQDAGHSLPSIEQMTPEEALDTWLRWEGIQGFTIKIIETLDALRAASITH